MADRSCTAVAFWLYMRFLLFLTTAAIVAVGSNWAARLIGDATGIGSGWVLMTIIGLIVLVGGAVGAWKVAKGV